MTTKFDPRLRTAAEIECQYLPEPMLVFGNGGLHVDPKAGIARYGPFSLGTARHPNAIRVGLIGTAETIDKSKRWLVENAAGVLGDEKHPRFPGFQADRGFFSELSFSDNWTEQITQSELQEVLRTRGPRPRFEATTGLMVAKLRLMSERDQPPDYVLVGLPNALLEKCRVADYRDSAIGVVHRDLRRAFKALAMAHRIPTQLLRQPTMEGRDRDHPSKIAWNFYMGMYFKGGAFLGPLTS